MQHKEEKKTALMRSRRLVAGVINEWLVELRKRSAMCTHVEGAMLREQDQTVPLYVG